MTFEEFKLGETVTALEDVYINSAGAPEFKKGKQYKCTAIFPNMRTVQLQCEIRGLQLGLEEMDGWFDFFESYVKPQKSPTPPDIVTEIYDAWKNNAVTKEQLERYQAKTGKKRPGFMG